ncbi:MAG: acyl carrier protein [Candidatus Omnitrophota bacterium]
MSLFEEIRETVSKQLKVETADIKPDTLFVEDLGADSLDTVELVMALEEKYDIEIPDEDAEKILTISDVVKYIENKINSI